MTKNPFRYFKTSRAVDHEGEVLESYVTKTRDKQAAFTFQKKAMKRYGSPRMVVTDRLLPYGAAMKEIGNEDRKEVDRHLNNRAEDSHLPFRRRERAMSRIRRMSKLQKFVSTHASFHNHFNLDRHINHRQTFKSMRNAALFEWRQLLAG
jgi:putative transposase